MKIGELLQCIKFKELIGGEDVEITGLCADSQKVSNGDLFFCYKGNEFDSHDFASEAVACGAAAIVCERKLDCSVPQIIVPDGRRAIAPVARAFYGYADKKLKLVGITGTNGKTTTTYILKSIFDEASKKAGIIGTLGISYADKFISPELTTPDPIYLHSVFADMVNCGVEYVFMEVSTQSISTRRPGLNLRSAYSLTVRKTTLIFLAICEITRNVKNHFSVKKYADMRW